MGQNKLQRFAELHTFSNVVEADFRDVFGKDHYLKGKWNTDLFKNNNPIILELGCGKGEYTIALAKANSNKNFIGVDIKGNRMWVGAKQALELQLINVAFLRTRIEFIQSFFASNEVDEIWITFPDPQPQKNRRRKRLTSPVFLNRYKTFLKPNGCIHLKTDSEFLFEYTLEICNKNNCHIHALTDNLYCSDYKNDVVARIQTYYEKMFLAEGKPIHYIKFSLNEYGLISQ